MENSYLRKNIIAVDSLDLSIISSMVQDCIILKNNITFLKKQRIFVLLVNRFRWEHYEKKERVYSIVRFHGVLGVKTRKLDLNKQNLPLELLAINYEDTNKERLKVYLHFAGGTVIKLNVECLECILKDLSDPWITNNIPNHDASGL